MKNFFLHEFQHGGVISPPSLNIQVVFLTCMYVCMFVWVCVHARACVHVWVAGLLGYSVKVSPCKYAEHGRPHRGAEGERGVAELIYLMTWRLISSQP